MLDIMFLTEFLGWCTLINIGLLSVAAIFLAMFGGFTKGLHSKMYGVSEEYLDTAYFNFLGNYKLAIFIFNLVPYCALKVMS